ncbi:serine/threonine-protein kinase [Hyalangium rubrum]|uniref:Protein kinase n=1 Tax=Hyalangium rubrum TaxID=3103134 RepID=A0ABU5H4E1_9BACT|nr:protein kinase [Hyalangium sp. s54d21]MDY7228351.1 protein kinase [Hyalangium sp. s54d21]
MRCPTCHRRLALGATCPVHAQRSQPAPLPEPLPPPDVPGLRGFALLGTGGFSHVFTAWREADGREVAFKVGLGPHRQRFALEALALSRVGPPTVPELLQHGTAGGRPFLVLEALRGQTLAAWMATLPGAGAASLLRVRELLAGVCAALEHVHAAGLAHRDLKPENIFLREGGELSLLDFGLARFLEAPSEGSGEGAVELTRAGERLGTPVYMAPEQCLDAREAGTAADIYALGVLLFELLTGAPPFTGSADEIRHGHVSLRPPSLSRHAELPPALDEVLRRCLAKSPAERFARAAEVLSAFDAACRLTGSAAPEKVTRAAVSVGPGSGVRSVALLGVQTRAPVDALLAAIEPHGGSLARAGVGGYLVVFPESLSAEASLRAAALAAWRLIEEHEAAAVLHLAELHVRPGVTRTRVAGRALESTEGWWSHALQAGQVRVTAEATACLDADATKEGPGGVRVLVRGTEASAPTPEALPLVGRESLLEALKEEATRSLGQGVPGLCVLTGEIGYGKTRLLDALAASLEADGRTRVQRLRALPPDTTVPHALLDALRGAPAPKGAPRHAAARALAELLRQRAREVPQVLLLDDAHLADPTTLDTLEMATLAGTQAPLWICVAARPTLLGLRPHFGERSGHVSRHALPTLSPETSRALLLQLLRPVEHIPEPVLARLEQLAQGVPLSLVELARALRAAGALRTSPGGGWYLAPDVLLDVSVTPLFERLATRALLALPESFQVLARLCAVLGNEVDAARVDLALRNLDPREGGARVASLDAGAGLARLERAGLLRSSSPGRFVFRHPLLREVLEATLPPPTRRALHAAALRALGGEGLAERRRRAHHAAGAGAHEEAATAFLGLAEEARHAHLPVEAEQHYTRALALLPEGGTERRARALTGRGRVRHRLQRFRESLEDLTSARALAEARADHALAVDLLLEEATVRDWMEDVEGSAERTREAMERIEQLDDPRLSVRCTLARGRLHVRMGEWEAASRVLSSAVEGAIAARDSETHLVALALWGAALTFLDRPEEAAARFGEAIARCEEAGDALHLAAACINRVLLWLKLGDVGRMEEDLRRARALGRELGHAQVERWSTFNLAEVLYVQGRLEESLPLARRAHELEVRFFRDQPVPAEALLIARIAAALGDMAEAARQLRWIEEHCPPRSLPPAAIMRRLVELQVREAEGGGVWDAEAWRTLAEEARELASSDEMSEILLQAAQGAMRHGNAEQARQWLAQAARAVEGAPLWRTRLERLQGAHVTER